MGSSALPPAGRLAWWGTAWLRGAIGPDQLLDGLLGAHDDSERDVAHVLVGPHGAQPLLVELAGARNAGAAAIGAAFPAPGDPVGVRGPREFTSAAIEAGEAALLIGTPTGLVPQRVGRAVEWASYSVDRRPPPDTGEADRALRAAVLHAADALAALDVAHWRPEVADELMARHEPVEAPPGTPDRCIDVAARALHLWHVVDLALADDGGALSASEAVARRDAIAPLERAVRHALTAACSPDGWPHR